MKHVLVVGGGGAGLTAAIAARKAGAEVTLVCKTAPGEASCTAFSGGGFSLASGIISPEDHYRRVLETGRYVNDNRLVRVLAEEGEGALRTLSGWGVSIVIGERGHASCRKSAPSPLMGGGGLTKELAVLLRETGVSVLENHVVTRLLTGDGGVEGAEGTDWKTGRGFRMGASAVILAAGGGGRIFPRTDNPARMTGDGYALALGAGAKLVDMEYVQFYPMGWDQADFPVWMVGLPIVDFIPVTGERGEEFLPEAFRSWGVSTGREANLYCRDRAAILMARRAQSEGKALLHLEALQEKHLSIPEVQSCLMIDLPPERRQGPVSVSPIQHYFCGGIPIDARGRASIPGLYACGEVTGGVDGASRMGGNALTAVLTFALAAGRAAAEDILPEKPYRSDDGEKISLPFAVDPRGPSPSILRRELQDVVGRGLCPCRNGRVLEKCLSEIEGWRDSWRTLRIESGRDMLHALELNGLYVTALSVSTAALLREESRGVHFRDDFPEERREWKRRIVLGMRNGRLEACTDGTDAGQ